MHEIINLNEKKDQLYYSVAFFLYIICRVAVRLLIGKKRRNDYFLKKKIGVGTFFPSKTHIFSKNGIKACVRRNTDDYLLLFVPREQELFPHLKLFKNEVFVDVGANVGFYTLRSSTLYPNNTVIAIEAHPKTFNAMKKNVIEINNFKNVILVNKAVYHSKDKIKLYDHGGFAGHSSFYRTSNKSVLIDCDTLDNILSENKIQKANVIKMDIEGAEIDALSGAKKTLSQCRKIIVEAHFNNLQKIVLILSENNFSTEILSEGTYVIGSKGLDDQS